MIAILCHSSPVREADPPTATSDKHGAHRRILPQNDTITPTIAALSPVDFASGVAHTAIFASMA